MMIHILCLSFFNLKVCMFFMCLCLCLCVSFTFIFQPVCVCVCVCVFYVCVFVDVSVSFNLTHIKDSNSIRGFMNVVFQLLTVSVLWALFIEKGGAIQLFDHNIKEKSLTLRFFDITFQFYITLHKSTFSGYI